MSPEESGQLEFLELASAREEEQPQQVSKLRSLVSAPLKGAIKGLHQFGRMFGPLPVESLEEQMELERFPEIVEEFLPTREGFVESAAERAAETLPLLLGVPGAAGPLQAGIRAGAAGILGQTAEEAGFGETGQALAEIPAFVTPAMTGKLVAKKGQKRALDFMRRFGMSDAEITPVLQREGIKTNILAKAATKQGRAQKALDKTKKSLGSIYNSLRDDPRATAAMSPVDKQQVVSVLQKELELLPQEARKLVAGDFAELITGEITGSKLINFFQDLNFNIAKGNSVLTKIKDPVKAAIAKASPELAQDFGLANELYGKFATTANKLKPTTFDKFFSAGKALGLLGGFVTGNVPLIAETVGISGAKSLAREMLINPRFQNLSGKLVTAINQNKVPLTKTLVEQLQNEIAKTDPDAAQQLRAIDIDELFTNQ